MRLSSALVAAALLAVSFLPAHADQLDDIKARGRLLVGVGDSTPPFSFVQPGQDKAVGYDVDLAERLAHSLGVPAIQVMTKNSERIPFLQQGKVDIIALGMTRATNRMNEMDFSYAYLDSPHKIIIRKDSGLTSIKQLAGKQLALNKGASVDAELKEAVPTLAIVNFDDYAACFAAVKEKRVAAFLADRVVLLSLAQKDGRPEDFTLLDDYDGPRTAGFGLRKGEAGFKTAVNKFLLDLEASGEAAKIYASWFGPTRGSFRITPD
jgi:polar amino acid transport system substrate-binding protein